jgi:hypothetical protein
VLERGLPEHARMELKLVEVGVGDHAPAEVRPKGVDDREVSEAIIADRGWVYPIGMCRYQEGNKRGTRHLHTEKVAAARASGKPWASNDRFVQQPFS